MRIHRIALGEGTHHHGAEPQGRGVELQGLAAGLNVLHSGSAATRGELARLAPQLVFGRTASDDRPRSTRNGSIDIETAGGPFRLKRRAEREFDRLTVASLGGEAPPQNLKELWLEGCSPAVLETVYCPAPTDSAHWTTRLLSPAVASALRDLQTRWPRGRRGASHSAEPAALRQELILRRDALAADLEKQLGLRRLQSDDLETQLTSISEQRDSLRGDMEELRRELDALSARLGEIDAADRAEEVSRIAGEETDRLAASEWAPRLRDLDEQIDHWRATLAEIELREARVQAERAQARPDDESPLLGVADQRACVAVSTRLLRDLESEVARLARPADSPACVCGDAHPRLNPLVETLGSQLERLAQLVESQDRALRSQELKAEGEQLARSKEEMRQQLDRLLERRQTLGRTTRGRQEMIELAPADPAARDSLVRRRTELIDRLDAAESRLAGLEATHERLVRDRSELLSHAEVESLQRELRSVQERLDRGVWREESETDHAADGWRASDLIARLSDGELTTLKLIDGGRSIVVIDRHGRRLDAGRWGATTELLVAWSLSLALADAFAARGVATPLVAEEPFAGLDDRHAANLATLLDDYGRRGRQALVTTDRAAALDRFRWLGTKRFDLSARPAAEPAPPKPAPRPAPTQPVSIVKETLVEEPDFLMGVDDPIERFPAPIADRAEVFGRARVRTVGDLIGADPSAVAEEIDLDSIPAELVAQWQEHLALVCFVVGLRLDEAALLTECGVRSVGELAEADTDSLLERATRWLASGRGERLRSRGFTLSRDLVDAWIERADAGRSRWRSSAARKAWRRHRSERRERIAENSRRRPDHSGDARSVRFSTGGSGGGSRKRSKRRREPSGPAAPKYYLETTSPVVDAPSIGPKTAEMLQRAGVRTVAELLEADAERLAGEIDSKRVDAATVVAWQHQAHLVCCVPELRGHDAQVLVGCGFTTVDGIASMKPAELLEFVEPFCETSEGERALRGAQKPDLDEVTGWIRSARRGRAVGAA
ncbi:hypothetical protein Mal64_06330 [Pseudobythopirellula maris]|uniref:DUF4332 domain-containing protein n=1 Tax=Pseudobythopirellula maris TaxID=2527991 RepID=A0A5C5ZRV5_9BACT|nr:DUF4332 domain-containing protein [Pseudobythopirellula maris]TWT90249.1 hypothetical protein Mal64_06330 [Pseudobythopirellula maris]